MSQQTKKSSTNHGVLLLYITTVTLLVARVEIPFGEMEYIEPQLKVLGVSQSKLKRLPVVS